MMLPDALSTRSADHPIESLFLRRWSPRAMSGAPVAQAALDRLLEAARWAPSSFNEQEWRFRYAHRDGQHCETFLTLLTESNRAWCKNAGVLVAVFSKKTFSRNGRANPVHAFDAGAAFQSFCLQAAAIDLVAHGMAGFDREAAHRDLLAGDDFAVQAMIAVGHPGDPEALPESLRAVEKPSGRRPIEETAGEGPFET